MNPSRRTFLRRSAGVALGAIPLANLAPTAGRVLLPAGWTYMPEPPPDPLTILTWFSGGRGIPVTRDMLLDRTFDFEAYLEGIFRDPVTFFGDESATRPLGVLSA